MPKHEVSSFEAFKSLIADLEGNPANKIYVLFTATKDENAVCPLVKKTDAVTGNRLIEIGVLLFRYRP